MGRRGWREGAGKRRGAYTFECEKGGCLAVVFVDLNWLSSHFFAWAGLGMHARLDAYSAFSL